MMLHGVDDFHTPLTLKSVTTHLDRYWRRISLDIGDSIGNLAKVQASAGLYNLKIALWA